MVKMWVSLLAIAIVWICGTLPWVVIGDVLCSQEPPVACPDPMGFWNRVGIVVTLDMFLVAVAGLSIHRLRQLDRTRRGRVKQ